MRGLRADRRAGYNFRSLRDISPFLEPTGAGISSLWARTTALKHNCTVTVGYPETADVSHKWPTGPEYYNATIVVGRDGETITNYRKSFLFYTDETWALEGQDGFFDGYIPGLGYATVGICMDINPYQFEAPWEDFEFASHVTRVQSNLVIISMSWMTREDTRHFSRMPDEPDMETLAYWVSRFEPLIRSENKEEVIVVFCNRTGSEGNATYVGTSVVLGIHDGEVKVYGLLGRGSKELLVVDTDNEPYAKLALRPEPLTDGTRTPISPNPSQLASVLSERAQQGSCATEAIPSITRTGSVRENGASPTVHIQSPMKDKAIELVEVSPSTNGGNLAPPLGQTGIQQPQLGAPQSPPLTPNAGPDVLPPEPTIQRLQLKALPPGDSTPYPSSDYAPSIPSRSIQNEIFKPTPQRQRRMSEIPKKTYERAGHTTSLPSSPYERSSSAQQLTGVPMPTQTYVDRSRQHNRSNLSVSQTFGSIEQAKVSAGSQIRPSSRGRQSRSDQRSAPQWNSIAKDEGSENHERSTSADSTRNDTLHNRRPNYETNSASSRLNKKSTRAPKQKSERESSRNQKYQSSEPSQAHRSASALQQQQERDISRPSQEIKSKRSKQVAGIGTLATNSSFGRSTTAPPSFNPPTPTAMTFEHTMEESQPIT